MPIGSMRLQRKERRKRNLQYVTKFMFFGGALGLIVIAALRFTTVNTQTVHNAILNFYYLFFGIVLVLSQMNIQKVVD